MVHIQPGRSEASLANFYASQSDSALAQIQAVSMDVAKAYTEAIRTHVPQAVICYDPFHIMQWANRALDAVYSEAITGRVRAAMTPAQWRTGRWALRTRENKLSDDQRVLINQIARTHRHIGRAWTLKEQLRDLYRLHHPPGVAPPTAAALDHRRQTQPHQPFVALAKRLQVYFGAVIAAIELGISNALIEGINAKIRLINARNYGHHSAQTLASMIYLTLGGLQPKLPTRT